MLNPQSGCGASRRIRFVGFGLSYISSGDSYKFGDRPKIQNFWKTLNTQNYDRLGYCKHFRDIFERYFRQRAKTLRSSKCCPKHPQQVY